MGSRQPSPSSDDRRSMMFRPTHTRLRTGRWLLSAVASALVVLGLAGQVASAAPSRAAAAQSTTKPTVVLVHGAFADASGWGGVIERLERRGYPVVAPANPLRGVKADSDYLRAFLATI